MARTSVGASKGRGSGSPAAFGSHPGSRQSPIAVASSGSSARSSGSSSWAGARGCARRHGWPEVGGDRSAAVADGDRGLSAGPGQDDGEEPSDSSPTGEESSEIEVPLGVELSEWSGIDTESSLRCGHMMPPHWLIVWDKSMPEHTGRRFFACPLEDQLEECDFLVWFDAEWPEMLQKTFVEVWKVLLAFDEAQAVAREKLAEKEEELRPKDEQLRRTRTVASHACSYWQAMMNSAMQEKTRVAIIAFILAGVILLLLLCLVGDKKKG
ncbi:hypothetical protein ACP4OV_010670 [Aristida adscensionis]